MAGTTDLSNRIAIKGLKDGLVVSLGAESTWAEVTEALMARIDAQAAFFQGGRVAVSVGDRLVRSAKLAALRSALSERGITLWAVIGTNPDTVEAARLLGLETSLQQIDEYRELEPIDTEVIGSEGVLVRQTLRSGGTVRHGGHVVVIGDVNPGAEIVAGGDVVVWGRLRGTVHAGAYGDERAVVCALELAPMQLRIAGHIAVSPPNDNRRRPAPEVASVRNGQIVANPWKTR
ncbi:MAG: septum site-determining protein MinC [Anaerolineae bacterium]|nr:septum site-determining protein MinC [Anaerolineae bacterium]